jgi:hypothetical protein
VQHPTRLGTHPKGGLPGCKHPLPTNQNGKTERVKPSRLEFLKIKLTLKVLDKLKED